MFNATYLFNITFIKDVKMPMRQIVLLLTIIISYVTLSFAVLDTSDFTVGIWSVPNDEFSEVAGHFEIIANPFKASWTSSAPEFLDSCEAYNMEGICGVDCQMLEDTSYLEKLANAIKDHPAYSAIMLFDEPTSTTQWCDPVSPLISENAYGVLKSIDPIHPIFIDDYIVRMGDELITLKPILKQPNLSSKITIESSDSKIAAAIKEYDNKFYLIAYNFMRFLQ